jgi:hypothetical protein
MRGELGRPATRQAAKSAQFAARTLLERNVVSIQRIYRKEKIVQKLRISQNTVGEIYRKANNTSLLQSNRHTVLHTA